MMQMHCSLFQTLAPNMLFSSLSSDQQLVFRQESLGSSRNASPPSLFITQRRVCSPGWGCCSSRLRLNPTGSLRCSKALLVFSISGSFLSSGSCPAREEQKPLPAQGWGSSQGEMLGLRGSSTARPVCLVFSAHHTHLLLLLIASAR